MAAKSDLNVDQGTDYSTELDLTNDDGTPINVAGYSFVGVVSKSYYSPTPAANLTIIVTSNANGNLLITMPANVSSNIQEGRYLYSVKMTDGNNITTRLLEGILTILPDPDQRQPFTFIP